MVSVFSIPAFFIVLREVLEACLVVGIALAYFKRTGNQQYVKWVWWGAGLGVAVSLGFGVAFAIVYATKGNQIFEGNAEKIFEGIAFLVAAALLTWMIIWMMYMGKELAVHLENRLDEIMDDENRSSGQRKFGVFFMVFVQVLREGIETFIFLFGSVSADKHGGWRAIPLPGILAIIVGIAASFLVFKGMVSLDIQGFFFWSSFLLIAFAAGLVSHAFHEMQEVDWFGPWKPSEERDWYNAAMWSTKRCCHDKENEFWAMMRALFGYQDTPTFVEWITYFAYWLIVIALYVAINWDRIRASRMVTYARATLLSGLSLLFTFVGFVYVLLDRTWVGLVSMIVAFCLSIATVAIVFDPVAKLANLGGVRKTAVKAMAYSWAVWTLVMVIFHFVELICEGTEEDSCDINMFFFFGLIFDQDFNNMGRTTVEIASFEKTYWPTLAVLSVSLVVTLFFFGGLSFRLFLMSMNIDTDGTYMHDDYVNAKMSDDSEQLEEREGDALDKEAQLEEAQPHVHVV